MIRNIKFQYVAITAITFISLGIYFNSLNNPFVFDDLPNIVENPYIRNLKDFPLLFKGIQSYTTNYRALPTITFAINYHLHQLNVLGYRLVNLFLHILSGILVYSISRYLFLLGSQGAKAFSNDRRPLGDHRVHFLSLLTAFVFVTHPIQVNTVTYIVERNEGLASFFYLLTFFLFIKGTLGEGTLRFLYLGSAGVSFLGSVFSKEIGFTIPIMLIIFDLIFICQKRDEILARLKIYIPIFLCSTLYILFFLKGGMLNLLLKGAAGWSWTPWENLLTQANVILQYFKLLLLPLPRWLNIDHDFQVSKSLMEYPTGISVSVILALLALATVLSKKKEIDFFFDFLVFYHPGPYFECHPHLGHHG